MSKQVLSLVLLMFVGFGCAVVPSQRLATDQTDKLPKPSLKKIAKGVWIHKSYEYLAPWGPILSQGLVVKTEDGIQLIDTAWNNTDTEYLLNLIVKEVGGLPKTAYLTHAHQDKMGGVDTLHAAGITTYAHEWSIEDAAYHNLSPPQHALDFHNATFSQEVGVYFYPGAGHTRDNIVYYHSASKVLFVGCLVRPGGSNNLGNIADADMENWARSIRRVAAKFPQAQIIIPSHGPAGKRDLLDHTLALLEAANE